MNMDWMSVGGFAVSIATAAGTILTARAGRLTKGQERRSDFETITKGMRSELERLGHRLDEAELEAAEQKATAAAQEFALRYLVSWVRNLVAAVRAAGQEPPAPPEPVPEAVRPYLTDIGV